jgi:uncharacterized protein (UPF0303 family)
MTDRDLLAALLEEEERLLFASFDYATAWQLGSAMRQAALEGDLPLTLSIRRGGQRLFHAALPGSSGNNDAWLERKCAVVDLFGHSSYYVGCQSRADGHDDFNVAQHLDPERFAAHGGAFPLLLRGSGCVGTIAVSGLPELDDHRFVVAQLERFLTP